MINIELYMQINILNKEEIQKCETKKMQRNYILINPLLSIILVCKVYFGVALCGRTSGLDIGLWPPGPGNQKIHWPPQKNPLAPPPKTCNDPNVFAAGIYDFTREVAHFCTLGLYITKNEYELTLPSEFCRFPVKIMAAYEALKKKKKK